MLDLADDWVWDFWVVADPAADDGTAYHLFFLKAPRTLGDPDLRHWHASVGHAVSADLSSWTRVTDALDPQPPPAFDDLATWTGSVVRDDDGRWWMFTTGLAQREQGRVQRIGVATSRDLTTWVRDPEPVLEADPRWYGTLDPDRADAPAGAGREEHWRDPWVERDADGTWHLYATAQGMGVERGVVAHAVSDDLHAWDVLPPLSTPSARFRWLEVISLVELDGRWALLFSCLSDQMPYDEPGSGGVWSVPVAGPGAPVDVDRAVRLTSEDLYVGKVARRRDGSHCFLAFENRDEAGRFRGGVIDPVGIGWNALGTGLELRGGPARWRG
ncbi:hypothetical protein GCM10009844_13330 [Nocardioides koreensis]|uniref:beta-fructofuranosidase n=1 Tax=Nocardioides koreensis TaxID=433651 RepID=A0ABN2ZHM3_9ACTN